MMIGTQQRITVNPSVVCAELDDEMVLLNAATGLYFGLDPLGTRIWQLIAEGNDEGSIAAALIEEYEVEPARLRADVGEFLVMLAEKELIKQ